ncbi:MAG: succinate dehydrogenase/fumarate reductase iron-sulfur subunit [Desulfuromonadaceae bacterium]|nr:succinate dehydrogenase/fumarate reductase iron-sulfur subunit [Desulfuromonadaceae bacterium]
MNLTLHVWRQKGPQDKGKLETYPAKDVSSDMSFLEMLDEVNDKLIKEGKDPIAFDHDCREGICGMCSSVVNGRPHGHQEKTTVCQLHMRQFEDGADIVVEPWLAKAFPIQKDLIVDRSALDVIMQAGGYTSCHTGGVVDANSLLIPKPVADFSMDAAECIGCGACIAACPNSSAMLFTSAKVAQLAVLPQGKAEAKDRVLEMTKAMLDEGFGNCTNHYECQEACPKGISVKFIATLNREYLKSFT